ncbi:MAG: hypothetical protein K6V73_06480 [Firmicutes bacterium]|nr:hypothetical protein [Bacillota bacterium]
MDGVVAVPQTDPTLYGGRYAMALLQNPGFPVTYGGSSAGTSRLTVVFPSGSLTSVFVVGARRRQRARQARVRTILQ